MDVALMIEGQNGLTWPRWQRIARAAEDLGFAGLYRSDHYTNPSPPDKASLELWVSLTWLASHTSRLEFGPIVSPVSFRHPVTTAWQASAVDSLSGGRLRLGLGAGWQEREHRSFGFDLLDTDRRFERFEEGLKVVTRLLRDDGPSSFTGEFYRLDEALLMPRSPRPGGTPIVIGGNGPRRTLPLVARYADEWNGVFLTPDRFVDLNARLNGLLDEAGRARDEVRRTLMTRAVFGATEAEVDRKLGGADRRELDGAVIIGTANEVVERLGELEEAGVQRVMLQWLEVDDVDGLEAMAGSVLRG